MTSTITLGALTLVRLRRIAERFYADELDEDLDAQAWGESMNPCDVLALLDNAGRCSESNLAEINRVQQQRDQARAEIEKLKAENEELRLKTGAFARACHGS